MNRWIGMIVLILLSSCSWFLPDHMRYSFENLNQTNINTPTIIQKITVSTFAGSGTAGSVDDTGTAAQFNSPCGMAFDASGNLYVAEYGGHRIRKITKEGVVTTIAGNGSAGFNDANGTSAQFNNPHDLAIDTSSNLYVADTGNHRIRKITPSGDVTTFAGSGSEGSTDATGTSASFVNPIDLVFDASGNLYVTDLGNHKIRKITSGAVVTTFAGSGSAGYADGTGSGAIFNNPVGICIDASGNLYVTDLYNQRVRKITTDAVVTTIAGSGTEGYADGNATSAQFSGLHGIAVDSSGNVYVADYVQPRIRKISTTGIVSTIAGSGTLGSADGVGTSASFNKPYGFCMSTDGVLYISEIEGHKIRKITIETLSSDWIKSYVWTKTGTILTDTNSSLSKGGKTQLVGGSPNYTSELSTEVTGTEVSFYWKYNSDDYRFPSLYYVQFFIDDVEKFNVGGAAKEWENVSYSLTSGKHTLKWKAIGYSPWGFSRIWIDMLSVK